MQLADEDIGRQNKHCHPCPPRFFSKALWNLLRLVGKKG